MDINININKNSAKGLSQEIIRKGFVFITSFGVNAITGGNTQGFQEAGCLSSKANQSFQRYGMVVQRDGAEIEFLAKGFEELDKNIMDKVKE